MPAIEPHIKKYIDSTIDLSIGRAKEEFINESNRHMSALSEHFIHEMKMGFEALQDRPSESRVREIIREEVLPTALN